MTTPFEELANLDKLIHEPARLSILTALSVCESADFLSLRRLTGLSDGNLSVQLSKLEEAGLVDIQKQFVGKEAKHTCQNHEKRKCGNSTSLGTVERHSTKCRCLGRRCIGTIALYSIQSNKSGGHYEKSSQIRVGARAGKPTSIYRYQCCLLWHW